MAVSLHMAKDQRRRSISTAESIVDSTNHRPRHLPPSTIAKRASADGPVPLTLAMGSG
jgi:hypothetical protein